MEYRDLRTLEEIVAARGRFGHREHLELAWSYLERYPAPTAAQTMASAIRHLAAAHGDASKYHETLTLAWVGLVAVHRERRPAATFEQFLSLNQELLDQRLLDGHYSAATLWSDEARSVLVAPDLRALPQLAA